MKVQMLKELPINDDIITADVFLGYVSQMSLESIESIERPIALHLILKTADNMTKYTPEQVEAIFETRKEVIYQNKSGFKALLQWFFSKRRIRRTNPNSVLDTHHLQQLSTLQLTERQAFGYLLLTANGLCFLPEQILVFEAETHLLMRTISQQSAESTYHQFIQAK
ncbi:hypothetical protein [Paenibacillus xylanexedens]|uniref:hypothetical protein n=1 Tax=Paenibacillus xylanexedens TaxID=528191 RepID=UPI0011A9C3AA|nr:hypothetical protein [Paenibacillus xylanexedens]